MSEHKICACCGQAIRRGRLTDNQRRAAEMVAEGRSRKDIAGELRISVRGAKELIDLVYSKLSVPRDEKYHPRVILATWWHSELFQIGLRELGMLA